MFTLLFFSSVCELVLQNIGKVPIEVIEINLDSGLEPGLLSVDSTPLHDSLPLQENDIVKLPLTVFAAANFVNSFPPG